MRQTEPCLRNELMTSCDNTKTFKTKLETLRPIPSPYNCPLDRSDLFTEQCLTTSRHFFCTKTDARKPVMHTFNSRNDLTPSQQPCSHLVTHIAVNCLPSSFIWMPIEY